MHVKLDKNNNVEYITPDEVRKLDSGTVISCEESPETRFLVVRCDSNEYYTHVYLILFKTYEGKDCIIPYPLEESDNSNTRYCIVNEEWNIQFNNVEDRWMFYG